MPASVYYETDKFSIRGSAAYRQGYLTQVPGNDGDSVHGANETLHFEAQASYNINDKLKVSVEGIIVAYLSQNAPTAPHGVSAAIMCGRRP